MVPLSMHEKNLNKMPQQRAEKSKTSEGQKELSVQLREEAAQLLISQAETLNC